MIIQKDKLDFDDVLILPQNSNLSSRSKVKLKTTYKTPFSNKEITGIPIFCSNMDTVGCIKMAEVLSKFEIFTCLHKFYSEELLIKFFSENEARNFTFYTLGMIDEDYQKLKSVNKNVRIDKICVDVANGYLDCFLYYVKKIREEFPDAILMAGNVVTHSGAVDLFKSGADIVKCGLGSGNVCGTREVTGVGLWQLSAILECCEAAKHYNGLICSDGGCKKIGDISKALAASSNFVMLGSFFAGHDENEVEWEYEHELKKNANGIPVVTGKLIKKYMKFYGMSSTECMEKHGNKKDYRASEGKCVKVKYKGLVSDTIKEILGGLRSTCTYIDCENLKDLSKRAIFAKKQN